MLESTLHRLETGVMAALGNADAVLTKEICEIFHSQCESDPFYGLTTEFMQKFFKEEFHHVVGTCNCDQTYTNIIVTFDYWQEQLRGSLDVELLPQLRTHVRITNLCEIMCVMFHFYHLLTSPCLMTLFLKRYVLGQLCSLF